MEIREALEKAAETTAPESISSTPAPEVAAESATPAPETASGPDAPSPAASARARDEQGRFTTKPAETKPAAEKVAAALKGGANGAATAAPPAAEGKADAAEPPPVASAEPVKPAEPAHKPPQSWRADEREEFAKAPPKVQAAILRREREIQTKLNEVAETTKHAREFQQAAAPWEPMFRSMGLTSTQAFDVLARTQYALQTGSPQQKAAIVADVVRRFGVPIDALDSALAGQPSPQGQAVDPATIAQQVEQRIQAQFRAQAAQVAQARAQDTLTRFAGSHEFFDDVRGKMADILTARGQQNPTDEQMEDAYNLACMVTPEISAVMKQREAAKAAQSAQASTAATRAAASSVRSTPAAAPARTAQPKSIHDALAAAAEQTGFGR